METIENLRNKLRFRAWHRGTREMDLLMGSFADRHIADFDEAQLREFEEILTHNDPDLYNWISGREAPPANLHTPILDLLLRHRFAT